MKTSHLVFVAFMTACTGGEDVAIFEGTWTYNAGASGVVTCPGSTGTIDAGGNEDIRPGTDTDLVVISSDGCNIKFDVTANRADAIPGQQCSKLVDGTTTIATFNNASYTIQSGLLSFTGAGTIQVQDSTGEVTCTLAMSGTLHKVAN
jgi:hypothetical protein